MSERVPAGLRQLVRERAGFRCEYCLLHEDDVLLPHEPDHIVASKHRGPTEESNFAWTCFLCNRHKGADLSSVDPHTGHIVRLFNPRSDAWSEHFRLENGFIVPLTPEGRVTEYLLRFNTHESVEARRLLLAAGRYPAARSTSADSD